MRRPERFIRKAFTVDAMRVSESNMSAVAKWCGGKPVVNNFITLRVVGSNYTANANAHIGDWVVRVKKGFKVYGDKQFRDTFQPMRATSMKFDEILRVVREVMQKQDAATLVGNTRSIDGLAGEATNRILNIAL